MIGFNLLEWFSEGTLALQIFRIMAALGLLMGVIQLLLRMSGLGEVDDLAADDDGEGVISWTSVTAFLLGMGCTGSYMLEKGYPIVLAVLAGGLSGVAIASIFLVIIRALYRTREDNTFRIENCVGLTGTAYIRIPAREPGGQIQIVAQSRMMTLQAISDTEIPSGAKVRVVAVVAHDTLKVEPLV